MFVVTEISHRLSHQFVISLDRSRSRAVHDANHLIQRVEDSRRLSFLLAEGMSSPKGPRFQLFWLHDPSSRKSSVLEFCTSMTFRMYSTYAPNLQNMVQTTHIHQKSSGSRMIHVVIKTNNRDFSSFQHIQGNNRRRTELLHHE